MNRVTTVTLTLAVRGKRTLVAATATQVKRVTGRLVTLAKATRHGVAAGAPVQLTFTLKAADRRRLRAARRLLVRVAVTVTDDAGNRASVARRVTLITPS